MNYEEYLKIQCNDKAVHKPERYEIGEAKAIKHFFGVPFPHNLSSRILDVGCGSGIGITVFHALGYQNVIGMDINQVKVTYGAQLFRLVYCVDIVEYEPSFGEWYNIIWCSHAFEHMYDPNKALNKMKEVATSEARFYFVLPYPDLDPAPAHCAAKIIGTTIDDAGETVVKWFTDRGLELISKQFDEYREPEIWLEFRKSHE